jgi:hypothetical protein
MGGLCSEALERMGVTLSLPVHEYTMPNEMPRTALPEEVKHILLDCSFGLKIAVQMQVDTGSTSLRTTQHSLQMTMCPKGVSVYDLTAPPGSRLHRW